MTDVLKAFESDLLTFALKLKELGSDLEQNDYDVRYADFVLSQLSSLLRLLKQRAKLTAQAAEAVKELEEELTSRSITPASNEYLAKLRNQVSGLIGLLKK